MKIRIIFFLVLLSQLLFSQGEATNWYFGDYAGIKFNPDGSVTALNDSAMSTPDGSAVLSDSSGQLLFYTNGVTVYNKNHQLMPNGSGLIGGQESTQAATIVKKPDSANLYYIITVDSDLFYTVGLSYSVVDMTLNGGLGDVTAEKNIVITGGARNYLSIVKHANNVDYWIITHMQSTNSYYVFSLNSSGISNTPIVSTLGLESVLNSEGFLKFSPKGDKLVMTGSYGNNYGQLFDFDNTTGLLSNPVVLINGPYDGVYGAEFSSNGEVLYLAGTENVRQFNLTAADIPNSVQTLFVAQTISALQIGPDNKIYIGRAGNDKLCVINNPNQLGVGANITVDNIDLNGHICIGSLPSFNQSFFFTPAIQLDNTCEGDAINFNFSTSQTILSANWDFGDGNTSNAISPTHTYTNSGTFPVSVTINTPSGTGSNNRNITIYPRPVLINNTVSLKQCDDNNDGFSAFNLKEAENSFVASTTDLTFTYFENPTDAQDNNTLTSITNPTAYTNQVVSNDVVYVRIENTNGCFRVGQLNLSVSTTSIPSTFQKVFAVCDDVLSGSNTDGIATFDFSSVTSQIQALYPVGQLLTIKYYKNQADALAEQNAIADISNYTNIGYPITQNIYVRVDSQVNNDCLGLGHHITLNVERIPFIENLVVNQCDDNQDGFYGFDTSNLQTTLLNGLTGVSVSYNDQNGNVLPSPLPNPFVTTSQTITATATNTTATACYDEATIQFIVDDLPQAFPIATTLTTVCDDEINPLFQDGLYSFDTSTFQATILGSQTGMIVNYFDESGIALPSPLPNPFATTSQTITVEVINSINTTCKATLSIPFVIKPTPRINTYGTELVCSNNPSFIKTIDAGLEDISTITDFTYQWFLDGNIMTGETNYSLTVNTEGIYTVLVTNSENCSKTRTITVTASSIATIENVSITDLSDNNSIIVNITGSGDYEYSLDGENYQVSNTFYNVESGIYTVYVIDKNGCGIAQEDISLLGIPNYFTPNGDGYNDYWNIKGVSTTYNANTTIHIFDRYGKLLKQISPLSVGWDGKYLEKNVPSSDYWYVINLEDGRTFKGHFTLKR